MKALLLISSSLLTLASAIKLQLDTNEMPESPILAQLEESAKTMTVTDLKARISDLSGRWVGYGWFNRERISFPTSTSYTPYNITDFDESNLDVKVTEGEGVRLLHEILEFWPEGGKNLRSETDFIGVGYIRRVRYLKIFDGRIIRDAEGNVVVEPRLLNELDLHTETGLITIYWDKNLGDTAPLTLGKTVTISRGLNMMV